MTLVKFPIVLDNVTFRFPFILASGLSVWFSISNGYGIINIGLIPLIFSFLFVTALSIQEIVIKAVYYMMNQYKSTECYWLRYFTALQLDFLTECLMDGKLICLGEDQNYSTKDAISLLNLQDFGVIHCEFVEDFVQVYVLCNYILENDFKMLTPYLKKRHKNKLVKINTKGLGAY